MSECPDCWRAEATPFQRVMRKLADAAARPSPAQQMMAAVVSTYSIMLGGSEPTWYERHRDRWIQTGDEQELIRMARHVE